MNGLHFVALAVEQTLNLHQATRIVRYNIFRSSLDAEAHLTSPIAVEIIGICRKRSAEASADLRVLHDQFQVAHFMSTRAGLLLPSSRVLTAVVKGDFAGNRAPRSVIPSLETRKSENS